MKKFIAVGFALSSLLFIGVGSADWVACQKGHQIIQKSCTQQKNCVPSCDTYGAGYKCYKTDASYCQSTAS